MSDAHRLTFFPSFFSESERKSARAIRTPEMICQLENSGTLSLFGITRIRNPVNRLTSITTFGSNATVNTTREGDTLPGVSVKLRAHLKVIIAPTISKAGIVMSSVQMRNHKPLNVLRASSLEPASSCRASLSLRTQLTDKPTIKSPVGWKWQRGAANNAFNVYTLWVFRSFACDSCHTSR